MKIFAVVAMTLILFGCSSGNKQSETSATTSASEDTIPVETPQEQIQQSAEITTDTSGISSLRMGMTAQEVIDLLGEPSKKETVGNNPKKQPIEDWWFGENQKVRMLDGKVNHVVADVAYQKELFKKLVEAKKNNDEAEAARIMEELTAGHK